MLSQKQKMIISGLIGLSFFLIANFTNFFQGLNLIAVILQLLINGFVFLIHLDSFRKTSGITKFIAFWGIVIPVTMAGTTIWRVLIPSLF
jgi:hypothetical protein